MNRSVARLLVRLHASRWRARYGDEFEALLLEQPQTPAAVCDVLWSAASSRAPLAGLVALTLTVSTAAAVFALTAIVRAPHHSPPLTTVTESSDRPFPESLSRPVLWIRNWCRPPGSAVKAAAKCA